MFILKKVGKCYWQENSLKEPDTTIQHLQVACVERICPKGHIYFAIMEACFLKRRSENVTDEK